MNKHLNNWLDEVEGKDPETTNKAITKEIARQEKVKGENLYQSWKEKTNE